MKKLTTLACLFPLVLLNGCESAKPKPVVKSLDVAMTCDNSTHSVSFKRDMSVMVFDGKEIPLYSAAIKGPKWTYDDNVVTVKTTQKSELARQLNQGIGQLFHETDDYTYAYVINHAKEPSITCSAPSKDDLPLSVAADYSSPAAQQDNKEQWESIIKGDAQTEKAAIQAAKERDERQVKYEAKSAEAKKLCNIYASDIAAKTNLKSVKVQNAHPLSIRGRTLASCIIRGKGAIYGESVILQVTGNGNNYEYQ